MGLVIVIEPHGTYAIYEQIVNQIKNQIISGELQPDEALAAVHSGTGSGYRRQRDHDEARV